MTTHIILILGLIAIGLYIALDIARQRNRRLCEDVQAYYNASQSILRHLEALESYSLYLEARARQNNACRAGNMMLHVAVDVGEKMTMEGMEQIP